MGGGVFRPEHNSVYHFRGQGDAAYLMEIHRIPDTDEPRLQAAKKPLGVICWNVCPPAGTDDHGATSFADIIAHVLKKGNFFIIIKKWVRNDAPCKTGQDRAAWSAAFSVSKR